jgi:hypothetical protein
MIDTVARRATVLLRALVGGLWGGTANSLPRGDSWRQSCLESLETRQMLSAASTPSALLPSGSPPAIQVAATKVATKSPPVPVLSASVLSPTQIRLSWVAPSAKQIAISIRAGTTKSVMTVAGSKQAYVATGLKPATTYAFYLQALQPNGSWLSSKSVSVVTPAPPASVASPVVGIVYSAPITITHGGTYTGNWQSLDPNVPAVQIRTSDPVIIVNSNIRSMCTLIDAHGFAANITVRNTRGYGLNPNVRGRHAGRFLNVDGFTNVDVENNYLEGTAGIYLYGYQGNFSNSQTVKVLANQAKNIDGRASDGKGGYYFDPNTEYVQFFQIDGVQGIHNAEVAWNQVINEPGKSLVEDNINIYDSSGTANDPFRIHDNYIDGAYPFDPAHDTDYTGGGIMLGDQGSSFISAYGNQVLDTTNYGIAISSGHDNVFYNNRILSAGVLPNGTPIPTQNVGAYIWNANGESTFARNSGHDNLIGWVNNGGRNDSWVPDASAWTNNTSLSGNVTPATIQAEWAIWQNKLTNSGVSSGVQ